MMKQVQKTPLFLYSWENFWQSWSSSNGKKGRIFELYVMPWNSAEHLLYTALKIRLPPLPKINGHRAENFDYHCSMKSTKIKNQKKINQNQRLKHQKFKKRKIGIFVMYNFTKSCSWAQFPLISCKSKIVWVILLGVFELQILLRLAKPKDRL